MLPLCDASNKLFVSPRDCWKPWTHLGRAIGVRWPCAEWGSVVESPRPPRCAIGQSWLEPRLHMLSTTVLRCSTVLFLIFHFVVWISRMESVKIWRPPNRHSSSIGADANDTFRNSALPSCKVESWKSSLPASYSFILISISGNQEEFFDHLLWQSSNSAVTVVIQSAVTTWMTTSTKRFRTCRTCRRRQLWLRSHLLWLQELGEMPGIYTQRAWTRDMERHGETWRDMETDLFQNVTWACLHGAFCLISETIDRSTDHVTVSLPRTAPTQQSHVAGPIPQPEGTGSQTIKLGSWLVINTNRY